MRHHRSIWTWLGVAAATVTVVTLASRILTRRSVRTPSVAGAAAPSWELDEPSPDSSALELAPPSVRNVSARPHDHARRPASVEDAETIGADDLGAAFLARATGHEVQDDDLGDEELAGFQVYDGWR